MNSIPRLPPVRPAPTSGRFVRTLIRVTACGCSLGQLVLAGPSEDRRAVEQVYYSRRQGEKPPFERIMPPSAIDRLLWLDQLKEQALATHYGTRIHEEAIANEVARMEATSRAPDVLNAIREALGNDPERFARCVVRPLLVDRELRSRFDADSSIHGPKRHELEELRSQLLAASSQDDRLARLRASRAALPGASLASFAYRLTPAPSASPAVQSVAGGRQEVPSRSSSYTIEATLSAASEPPHDEDPPPGTALLSDLHPGLQTVLKSQLRGAGSLTAVVETPSAFLLYLATRRTVDDLEGVCLIRPKTSLEEWLSGLKPADSTPRHPTEGTP